MMLDCIKKKERIFKIFSDWPQEFDLIETFCMARRILGLWHFPKNPQNVSFLASLSLFLSLSPLLLFFPPHPAVSYISLLCLNVRSEREVRRERKSLVFILLITHTLFGIKKSLDKWFENSSPSSKFAYCLFSLFYFILLKKVRSFPLLDSRESVYDWL